jgi:hypothetical protein
MSPKQNATTQRLAWMIATRLLSAASTTDMAMAQATFHLWDEWSALYLDNALISC